MINWPIEIKQNKYTRWYEALIVKAKTRDPLVGYKEKHHIIPNSLIKNKDVVELTAREHYVAHLLLWRMDMPPKWHNKMSMALHVMVNGSGHKKQDRNYLVSSRIYESARVSVITAMKEYFAEHGGTMAGKKHTTEALEKMRAWQNIPEIKQQQRERVLGEKNHMFGKTHSEEMRKQISESAAAAWNDEMKEEKSKWLTEQWQNPEYKKKMIDLRKTSEGWLNRDWKAIGAKAAAGRKANGNNVCTPKQRKKMSDTRKARLASGEIVPWNKGKGTPIVYNGVEYGSIKAASRQNNISEYLIKKLSHIRK